MATGKFDVPDAALSPVFVVASLISLGLIDSKWFGIDFASTVFEFSGGGDTTTITLAMLVSLATIGYAYFTNRKDVSDLERVELWIVGATVALILAPPFMPVLSSFLSNDVPAFVAHIVQAGGVEYSRPVSR